MSQIKKTITINKDYLTPKKNRSSQNKSIKNKISISPNKLKNKYLKKIKQHKNLEQSKIKKDEKIDNKSSIEDETDEFKKSLNFINNFTSSSSSIPKKTLKNPLSSKNNLNSPPVHLDLPDDLEIQLPIPDPQPKEQLLTLVQSPSLKYEKDIPYGCLKGGVKPTFRTWQKTIKRAPEFSKEAEFVTTASPQLDPIKDKKERIRRLKKKILMENKEEGNKSNKLINIPSRKTKRTTTKKFNLGRAKNGSTIGILIKDKKTRKKIMDAQKEMKKKDITEIKKYLYDHGLIKVGTSAPANVIRQMYESSMLTGDIQNIQDGVLMNNFLSQEE